MILPEWSHRVAVDTISDQPLKLHIEANEQQRRDLCRRFRVTDLRDLVADIVINRQSGNIYHVSGTLSAKVTQPCVVTLEPLTEDISESFEAWFTEEHEQVVSLSKARREREGMTLDAELQVMEENEDPEPIEDGSIDVGEVVSQFLSLSITLYPQKPGAEHELKETIEEKAGEGRPNPFAALKDWKFKNNKDQ